MVSISDDAKSESDHCSVKRSFIHQLLCRALIKTRFFSLYRMRAHGVHVENSIVWIVTVIGKRCDLVKKQQA